MGAVGDAAALAERALPPLKGGGDGGGPATPRAAPHIRTKRQLLMEGVSPAEGRGDSTGARGAASRPSGASPLPPPHAVVALLEQDAVDEDERRLLVAHLDAAAGMDGRWRLKSVQGASLLDPAAHMTSLRVGGGCLALRSGLAQGRLLSAGKDGALAFDEASVASRAARWLPLLARGPSDEQGFAEEEEEEEERAPALMTLVNAEFPQAVIRAELVVMAAPVAPSQQAERTIRLTRTALEEAARIGADAALDAAATSAGRERAASWAAAASAENALRAELARAEAETRTDALAATLSVARAQEARAASERDREASLRAQAETRARAVLFELERAKEELELQIDALGDELARAREWGAIGAGVLAAIVGGAAGWSAARLRTRQPLAAAGAAMSGASAACGLLVWLTSNADNGGAW